MEGRFFKLQINSIGFLGCVQEGSIRLYRSYDAENAIRVLRWSTDLPDDVQLLQQDTRFLRRLDDSLLYIWLATSEFVRVGVFDLKSDRFEISASFELGVEIPLKYGACTSLEAFDTKFGAATMLAVYLRNRQSRVCAVLGLDCRLVIDRVDNGWYAGNSSDSLRLFSSDFRIIPGKTDLMSVQVDPLSIRTTHFSQSMGDSSSLSPFSFCVDCVSKSRVKSRHIFTTAQQRVAETFTYFGTNAFLDQELAVSFLPEEEFETVVSPELQGREEEVPASAPLWQCCYRLNLIPLSRRRTVEELLRQIEGVESPPAWIFRQIVMEAALALGQGHLIAQYLLQTAAKPERIGVDEESNYVAQDIRRVQLWLEESLRCEENLAIQVLDETVSQFLLHKGSLAWEPIEGQPAGLQYFCGLCQLRDQISRLEGLTAVFRSLETRRIRQRPSPLLDHTESNATRNEFERAMFALHSQTVDSSTLSGCLQTIVALCENRWFSLRCLLSEPRCLPSNSLKKLRAQREDSGLTHSYLPRELQREKELFEVIQSKLSSNPTEFALNEGCAGRWILWPIMATRNSRSKLLEDAQLPICWEQLASSNHLTTKWASILIVVQSLDCLHVSFLSSREKSSVSEFLIIASEMVGDISCSMRLQKEQADFAFALWKIEANVDVANAAKMLCLLNRRGLDPISLSSLDADLVIHLLSRLLQSGHATCHTAREGTLSHGINEMNALNAASQIVTCLGSCMKPGCLLHELAALFAVACKLTDGSWQVGWRAANKMYEGLTENTVLKVRQRVAHMVFQWCLTYDHIDELFQMPLDFQEQSAIESLSIKLAEVEIREIVSAREGTSVAVSMIDSLIMWYLRQSRFADAQSWHEAHKEGIAEASRRRGMFVSISCEIFDREKLLEAFAAQPRSTNLSLLRNAPSCVLQPKLMQSYWFRKGVNSASSVQSDVETRREENETVRRISRVSQELTADTFVPQETWPTPIFPRRASQATASPIGETMHSNLPTTPFSAAATFQHPDANTVRSSMASFTPELGFNKALAMRKEELGTPFIHQKLPIQQSTHGRLPVHTPGAFDFSKFHNHASGADGEVEIQAAGGGYRHVRFS